MYDNLEILRAASILNQYQIEYFKKRIEEIDREIDEIEKANLD